jgi:putative peptide zinc metalloprotease protein
MGAPSAPARGRGSDSPSRGHADGAAAPNQAAVPDSASLAPPVQAAGLELLGEVGGSGYQKAPALARRADGQTIQLTPLLYRLLHEVDGKRSYAELADALSEASGRLLTAEDVRFLVDAKLRPLGVLRRPDGSEPRTRKANPLLGLRCKLVLSNTRVTNGIAGIFTPLFHWPAVVAVLVGFFATTWWLAFDMGIASAAHQALYEPALLLLVLGLTFASAAFHEIGHAAACRFSGAKPGGMGVGLYLVWPAFYTDVSDAYRLGRAGRLRVDLGGLYFNAIYGLATLGLWALVHWDALLLVIVAQLVMMVRQLTPIVRFDGYHVLADATGVPDLFHHIKPTLLGLLPGRRARANGNPLKRWVRVVVTLWVLTVVPLLGALLTLMVLFVPRIVGTAWDSLGLREAALEASWARGDVAAVALALLSMVTVSLPVIGIAYLLWRIAGRTARRVWVGTAGRPALRAAAALAGAVVVAAVTWAWWPGEQYRPIEANESLSLASPLPDGLHGAAYVVNTTFSTAGFPTPEEPAGAASTGDAREDGRWMFVLIPQSAIPDGTTGAAAPPQAPGSGWAFPFDPPPAPKAGDNQAVAINTTDGSSVYDVALALVWVTDGEPVDQWNQAWALASCTGCDTTAVAFQVVVVVGYAQVITPLNSAVAVNYLCDDCTTQALAMQLVTTIATMPDDTALAELADVWATLEAASDDFDLQPLGEVQADLLAARAAILDILTSEGTATTTTADDTAGAGTTTTTSPTTTAATTTTSTTTTTAEEPAPANDSTTTTTAEEPAPANDSTSSTTTTGETTTSGETSSEDAAAAEEEPTTTGETTTTTPTSP